MAGRRNRAGEVDRDRARGQFVAAKAEPAVPERAAPDIPVEDGLA